MAFVLALLALLKFVVAFVVAVICALVIFGGIALVLLFVSYLSWRRNS